LARIKSQGPPKAVIPAVDWTIEATEEVENGVSEKSGAVKQLPKPVVDEASGGYLLGDDA